MAERLRARRCARQDRNPNPSRLRAGNHVIDQSALVAERPQHHRPARIYFQSHILGGDEAGRSWSWQGNVPGYGPRLIASENAAIAFPADLSGTIIFSAGPREAPKPRSRPPSIGTFHHPACGRFRRSSPHRRCASHRGRKCGHRISGRPVWDQLFFRRVLARLQNPDHVHRP